MTLILVESPGLAEEGVPAAGDWVGCCSPPCARAGKYAQSKMAGASIHEKRALVIAGFYRQIRELCQYYISQDDEQGC